MTQRLSTSVTATLDASGRGLASVGPVTPGRIWRVERFTTSGTSTANPLCRIFRGGLPSGRLLDTTTRGNGDVSEMETALELSPGETLTIEWSSGTAGSVMVLHIEGEITSRFR